MAYAHALVLNEDWTNPWVTIACNADAQHWTHTDKPRTARAELVVRADGHVREMLPEEEYHVPAGPRLGETPKSA